MNKTSNTGNYSFESNENNKSFIRLLKQFFAGNGVINPDTCSLSNNYHEKLPIIYANIRV
ncbi:hypothetical protein J2X31_001539 [Flavobacterium arsenatis]|uniref:Uncharacterized protein n=1 Tax=Flavobacterium arsenatis TaxID=1484332 RepID=A0ABU1TNJ8_9FLAO|nr:hypothetical protein [Flavobacterium arsenatis]MDR6967528.1 hypothetical protein [Flavobacterium arsenatis]